MPTLTKPCTRPQTAGATPETMSLSIRSLSITELVNHLPGLVDLLTDTVNGGASLGFLQPLSQAEARDYWLSLRPDLLAGSRLLLVAHADDRLVGSGQLTFPRWPNAPHRAELQKLLVTPALRGQGVGRSLMTALHDTARQRGRSLLLLNTRRGEPPESFYKGLGYKEVGVVPGYSVGPKGERYDTVALYQEFPL